MAYISEPVAGDKRIQLGNEEYGRTFAFGTNWTKIRVSALCEWNKPMATVVTQGLIMGVCEGTTNMYRSATCTDFIGIANGAVTPPLKEVWTLTSGTHYLRTSGAAAPRYISRIGGVSTVGAMTNNQAMAIASQPSTIHQYFALDITKNTSTSITLSFTTQTAAAIATDCTFANALSNAENTAFTSPTPALSAPSTVTLAYAGSSLWNSVNFVWDVSIPIPVPALSINTILVTRFY